MGNGPAPKQSDVVESRPVKPLESYMALLTGEPRQSVSRAPGPVGAAASFLEQHAVTGNQASLQSLSRGTPSLESVRFPFQQSNPFSEPSAWERYDYVTWANVEIRLDDLLSHDRDDAARLIVTQLKSRNELGILSADPRGRRILVRLYDELTSGSVWDDERESADVVAKALTKSVNVAQFVTQAKAGPVIPISADGLTHGSFLQTKLLPSGKIFIKPNSSGEDWNYKKNYPSYFELQGAEYDPRDVINVVLVDESPIPHPILAMELLRFGNATEYETLKKAVEAAAAGAMAPFSAAGMGGRALLEGAASQSPRLAQALSLTSGVSETSMTLARSISAAIEFADAAAIGWAGISSFIHSIEAGLIRRFGNDAKELLTYVHLMDTAMVVYGTTRALVDLADLINAIRQRGKALRDAAKGVATTSEDAELAKTLEVIVDRTDELSEQQKKILALTQSRLPGGTLSETAAVNPQQLQRSVGGKLKTPADVPPAWMLDDLKKIKAPSQPPPVMSELRAEMSAGPAAGRSMPAEPPPAILPGQSPDLLPQAEMSPAGPRSRPAKTPLEPAETPKSIEPVSPAKPTELTAPENPYTTLSPNAPAPVSEMPSGLESEFSLGGLEPLRFTPGPKTIGRKIQKATKVPEKPAAAAAQTSSAPRPPKVAPRPATASLEAQLATVERRIAALSNHPDTPVLQQELDYIRMWATKGRDTEAQQLLENLERKVDAASMSAEAGTLQPHLDEAQESTGLRTIEYTPEPDVIPMQLDPTSPAAVDATGQILMQHVENAIVRFEREGLTEQQILALRALEGRARSSLYDAYRGSRIDEFAKEAVMQDSRLEHVYVTVLRERGPDFFDSNTGIWYDMTTPRAWGQHVQDYGGATFGGFRLPTESR